jgi:hypothetical protein
MALEVHPEVAGRDEAPRHGSISWIASGSSRSTTPLKASSTWNTATAAPEGAGIRVTSCDLDLGHPRARLLVASGSKPWD